MASKYKSFFSKRGVALLGSIFVLLLAANVFAQECFQGYIYVNAAGGSDSNSGYTWSSAKKTITAAIRAANCSTNNIVVVKVAQGEYEENIGLKDNVYLVGGFIVGTNTHVIHTSIIKGNGTGSVVKATNVRNACLQGFTIRDGVAPSGGGIFLQGGYISIHSNYITANTSSVGGGVYLAGYRGIFSSNTIEGNQSTVGGGVYCSGLNSAGIIGYNTIISNTATNSGGGMYITASSGTINNNRIQGNTVSSGPGGGVYMTDYSGDFIYNYLTGNSARVGGGGYLTDFTTNGWINYCTVCNNTASGAGSGFFITDFDGHIKNSVLCNSGNYEIYSESAIDITYTCIRGEYAGTGNTDLGQNCATNPACLKECIPKQPCCPLSSDGTTARGHTGGSPPPQTLQCDITATCSGGAPVANAGFDQNLYSQNNQPIDVTLNGSASYDPDGIITSYIWTLNGETIATSVTATVSLPIGNHTVFLTVTDSCGAMGTSSVNINITGPQDKDKDKDKDKDAAAATSKTVMTAMTEIEQDDAVPLGDYNIATATNVVYYSGGLAAGDEEAKTYTDKKKKMAKR